MNKLILLIGAVFLFGCATTKPVVLVDTEQHFLIPALTEFKARTTKNGPLETIVRPTDTWAVDAAHLIKCEELQNTNTLK